MTNRRVTGPTRRSTKGGWTEKESDLDLLQSQIPRVHTVSVCISIVKSRLEGPNFMIDVLEFKKYQNLLTFCTFRSRSNSYQSVYSACVTGRTDVQCLHRWQKVLNPDLIKGPWSEQVAKSLPGRIGKQCRERWYNHLNPDIKKTPWTKEEESTLIKTHKIYGNSWAEIAKFLHGRIGFAIQKGLTAQLVARLDSNSRHQEKMKTKKSNKIGERPLCSPPTRSGEQATRHGECMYSRGELGRPRLLTDDVAQTH
ncbi:myb transcription factor [Medicago truncatula]|uniref:Myb transcription factor n=1 Tax=Medicago truncatula TaxID=3880 RepID=G7I543_MEDTR|nr:myb transcription factor [Medicago truncatula]